MGGACYITLIVLIISRLVCLSGLRFEKPVSFEVGFSELSFRSSGVYKSIELIDP